MTPLSLHTLSSSKGSRRSRRRVGRGNGSRGTYSGRGAKGQRSRTGGTRGIIRRSMRSLMERVPKNRGFRSLTGKYTVINVQDLDRFFAGKDPVTPAALIRIGMLKNTDRGVKILGSGKLTKALTVHAHAFSATAKAAIEAAGGAIIVVGIRPTLEEKKIPRQ